METLRSPKHLTGSRSRLSRADVPRLVRGPARRRGLAASLQDRHVRLARLPAMGARHRADRHRERHRGDEHRSGAGLRARRARWRERVGDRVRAQGRAGRRPRRLGCALRAAVPFAGARARMAERVRVFHSCRRTSTSRASRAARSACSVPAPRPSTTPPWRSRPGRRRRSCSRGGRTCRRSTSRSGRCFRASSTAIADLDDARRWRDLQLHPLARACRRRTSRCCAATAMPASPSTSPSPGSTWSPTPAASTSSRAKARYRFDAVDPGHRLLGRSGASGRSSLASTTGSRCGRDRIPPQEAARHPECRALPLSRSRLRARRARRRARRRASVTSTASMPARP